ncbi:MAG: hypothetical protein QM640_07395 [Niabella sp.]
MDNKVIIILGMHRSGTSLIAGWLYSCGLHVGERLLGAGIGNAEGHYEDIDFLEAHERILSAHGLPIDGITFRDMGPLQEAEKAQLRSLIKEKNTVHKEWGWKEPRTCLFTDAYRELIPGAFYVIVFRDYRSVVSSLITRMHEATKKEALSKKYFNPIRKYLKNKKRIKELLRQHAAFYLKVWIHYNRKILEHARQLPAHQYLFASQHALLQTSASFIGRMKEQWHADGLKYVPFEERYKKKLQSRVLEITPYIQDKMLLREADALQAQFTEMLDTRS